AAMDSISSYVNTSKRLGKGVYFSDLYSALKVTGVDRVELISPTEEIILNNFQAATCTSINLTIAGEE
ncbi:baseplate assembly protein, partial [Acinetobacter baumannii]